MEAVRRILAATIAYCRSDGRFLLVALLVLSLPQVAADLMLSTSEATMVAFVLGLLTLYAQLLLTYRLLDRAGAAPAGYHLTQLTRGRFPAAFAASFLSGAGILLGLILLIVPGVIAFLLWSLVLPVLAAENATAMTALRRSVAITRPNLAPVAIVTALVAAMILAAAGLSLSFDLLDEPAAGIGFSLWLNLSISAILLFASALWASAYLALRGPSA